MSIIDIESLLSEISAEAPCGEDVAYDQSFLELERMLQDKPDGGMVESGDQTAEEPHWDRIRESCSDLFTRSKDLRVGMYMTLSLLKTEGFAGLSEGLALLHGMLDKYWENLWPQLDPDDGNDPLERTNILASLAPPPGSFQDPMKFPQRISEAPLSNSLRLGRFSFRDILIASGEITAAASEDDKQAVEMSVIDAAFEDTSTEDLQATEQSVAESAAQGEAIEELLTQKVGAEKAIDLSRLPKNLNDIRKRLKQYLAQRGYTAGGEGEESPSGEEAVAEEQAVKPISGEIRSTDDVLRALDKICQYYERHEPSSPVPLILRRAQRLVTKSFIDIIRDLSPDAMAQVEKITGTETNPPAG